MRLLVFVSFLYFSCNANTLSLIGNSLALGYSVDSLEEHAINIEKRSATLKDKFLNAAIGTINLFNIAFAAEETFVDISDSKNCGTALSKSFFSLVAANWAVKLHRDLPTCKWEKKLTPIILFAYYNFKKDFKDYFFSK